MTARPPAQDPELLTRAHAIPFVVFMVFMILLMVVDTFIGWDHPDAPWWQQEPAQFIYPVQTLVTLWLLIYYRRAYTFNWSLKWSLVAVVFGAVGIGFWLLPTTLYDVWGMSGKPEGIFKWLGVDARREGFDPGIFENPAAYWASLVMRFFRAAVIVAFVEEIFWRGFIMRFVQDWEGNYWKQPFGKPGWISFLVVTALFMGAHGTIDYAGAFVYGSLTYLLCIWSKNLGACVVMHAVANFLMGVYIMQTGKYGLW